MPSANLCRAGPGGEANYSHACDPITEIAHSRVVDELTEAAQADVERLDTAGIAELRGGRKTILVLPSAPGNSDSVGGSQAKKRRVGGAAPRRRRCRSRTPQRRWKSP